MMNKKSFVLHNDSLCVLGDLNDEQAGRLFRAIYEYNRQKENNEILNKLLDDFVTKILFSPFKAQFDRDDEAYSYTIQRNKINGLKGGRPRKNPSGLNENPKNPSGYSGLNEKPKKADSDSDSKSDSDSDSVSNINNNSNELFCVTESHAPVKSPPINYDKIVDRFNEKTNGVFGLVRKPISDKRKKSIKTLIRDFGETTLYDAFDIACQSDFLKGYTKDFRATFDWIIKGRNFEKIISGNYGKNEIKESRVYNVD